MAMRISFETCNSAFGETEQARRAETARILALVSARVEAGRKAGKILDANGNKVGEWSLDWGCRCEFGKGA